MNDSNLNKVEQDQDLGVSSNEETQVNKISQISQADEEIIFTKVNSSSLRLG